MLSELVSAASKKRGAIEKSGENGVHRESGRDAYSSGRRWNALSIRGHGGDPDVYELVLSVGVEPKVRGGS